jgi:hypothetical protein
MATLAQLRSDLRTWTSTHANPAVLPDAICDECINAAIGLMQEAHLWRGQESTSITLTYPAAAESILLPADFVSQKAVYQLTGATRIPLAYIEKTRRDDFIREGSSVSGPRDMDYPQIAPSDANLMTGVLYAIWMELLYLYPPPAQDLTLVVDYWKRFPPLTDGTVDQTQNFLTIRYSHVVRQGALADAYAYLQEDERSGTYRQLFEATLTRAILDDKTLMLAGGSTSRGV